MNEAVIFAELIQLINREEHDRLKALIHDQKQEELKYLIVYFIKKYQHRLTQHY